jgi:prepilin-type N-terminal cleavage/methylation domain-containing protein
MWAVFCRKGSDMKTISHRTKFHRTGEPLTGAIAGPGRHRRRAGFTLVEMLVVITIIGILVALVVPAALSVRNAGKRATVVMDVKQLEMACQAYKEKFGEYPPDFAGDITIANGPAQTAILRHLARAFPRYQPGVGPTAVANSLTGFNGFLADVQDGWGLPVITIPGGSVDPNYMLSPSTALTFWLGGCPQWLTAYPPTDPTKPVTAFAGFAADPTNPFQSVANCASRIGPFYEFNLSCLYFLSTGSRSATPAVPGGIFAWPTSACSKTPPNFYPIVYFRAENGNYTTDGLPLVAAMTNAKKAGTVVYPAVDVRLSTTGGAGPYVWVNPSSVQIFSAGLNVRYATPFAHQAFYSTSPYIGPYEFPTGGNYSPDTYGNITNFSNGTLEDSMK